MSRRASTRAFFEKDGREQPHRRGRLLPGDYKAWWRQAHLTSGDRDDQNHRWRARGNQLARQWQLLHLIDRPAGVTVDGAARELGCAVRTIWRDLTVVQRAGFPIYDEKGADGHRSIWRVDETFKRQLPLKLTLTEIGALVAAVDTKKSPSAPLTTRASSRP